MILEIATLDIKPDQTAAFETAFFDAQKIISAMPGYLSHELRGCVENPDRYVLLVHWESLEAHTQGFRNSDEYQKWRELLHHFYDPFPTVEHFNLLPALSSPAAA